MPPWVAPIILSVIVSALIILALAYFLGLSEKDAILRRYLTILAFTGALGGIISGTIVNERRLDLMWFDPRDRTIMHGGFIADATIGLGGAWGVFLVLGRTMKIGSGTEDLMVLIGLGVVAGFAARRLLQTLGIGLDQRLAQVAQVQREIQGNQVYSQVQALYMQIDKVLDEFDAANNAQKRGMRERLEQMHSQANTVVPLDQERSRALVNLARVKKRLAVISTGDTRRTLLEEAIQLCNEAIRLDPDREALYYNRACYQALLVPPPIATIIQDMRRAIELLPENKEAFKTDPDLDNVRSDPDVAALLS
jgi:tetratricopeptide (TPR) repeat protein